MSCADAGSRKRKRRRGRLGPCLAALGLLALAPSPARADGDEEGVHAEVWTPWVMWAGHVGLTVGALDLAGWPMDDAFARIGIGTIAGGAPAALVGWLWGNPCGGDDSSDIGAGTTSCLFEALGQALVIAAVDLGAALPAMYFIDDVPRGTSLSDGAAAGWVLGWLLGEPLLGIGALALAGVEPDDSVWGKIGTVVWGQTVIATAFLGMIYAIGAPSGENWSVTLPVIAAPW